jgi:hypothetical protein
MFAPIGVPVPILSKEGMRCEGDKRGEERWDKAQRGQGMREMRRDEER